MVYALYTGDKQSTQNVSDPPAVAAVVAVGSSSVVGCDPLTDLPVM